MKYSALTAVFPLMLTAILFAGCNGEPPEPQTVVIDIRAISEAAGIKEQIRKSTATVRQQNDEDIKALSARLSKELEDEKAGFGDNPSEEDKRKIQALRSQLQKQIRKARLAGNERLAKEKSGIWQSFLDGIMPVAQKVALEHGASIILKARAGIFWFDESVDITNEVIRRIPANKDAQTADSEEN